MLCFRCGSPVADSALTCANCGQDLSGPARPEPSGFSELQRKLRQTGREWARPSAYQVGEVVLDRYEIRDIIGEGGLGTVYKALDQDVEVELALKVIAPEVLPDEAARVRCLRGLQPLRDLVHENVVRTFDVDRDGDRCFYAMQFLEGLTLRKIMKLRREKGRRFGIDEVEPIFSQLCRALGESSRRMAHGGLKPENVIILPDLLKITDFGLASALPRAAFLAAQQASGEAWSYVAPEIRSGAPLDSRADVYSVAVILVELLTGARYQDRQSAEQLEAVPLSFERVLQRALSPDPAQRHAHPGELGDELTVALSGKRPRSTQPYGKRASQDLVATTEVDTGRMTREPSDPGEPTRPRSLGALAEELPATEKRAVAAVEPETVQVAAGPAHEGTGRTHQLSVEDIEFASQQARLEPGKPEEDELLFAPPSAGAAAAEVEAAAEPTEKVPLAQVAEPEPGPVAARRSPGRRPDGVESGVIEGTQQISADMIIGRPEEDVASVSTDADDQETGRVRLRASGEIGPAAARPSQPQPDREARARDALQAFDFDATLQDKIESAARGDGAAGVAETVPRIEEASAPGVKLADIERPEGHPPARELPPVAAEVLGRDAVPPPLSPDVTMAVARTAPTPKGKTLPLAVLSFVLVLSALTAGVVYWIHRSSQRAARAELERKRILAEQLLVRSQPDARPAALAGGTAELAPPKAASQVEPKAEPAVDDRGEGPAMEPRREGPARPGARPEPRQSKEARALAPRQAPKVAAVARPEPGALAIPRPEPKPKAEAAAVEERGGGKKAEPEEPAAGEGEKSCPAGMRYLGSGDDGFCIDRYEYPGRGQLPAQGVGLAAARSFCKARGQRLCTVKEWLRACGSAFPYGRLYKPDVCNTGQASLVASGSKKACRSRSGVYDLSGNVSEWVEEGVAMGGDAKSEQAAARCSARSGGDALTGFRCCADPEWD